MVKRNGKSKLRKRAAQTRRGKSYLLWILLAVVAVLLVAYVGLVIYFKKHFFPKTELNGLQVGKMTADEAQRSVETETKDYLLTVFDRAGQKYHIKGYDIDYAYRSKGEEKKILDGQGAFAWPVKIWKEQKWEMPISIDYDQQKLADVVSGLDCLKEENITRPQDAHIEKGEKGYQIVKEVKGNELIPEKLQEEIKNAVDAGENELALGDSVYVSPQITEKDEKLTGEMKQIEHYLKATVTYDIPGSDEKIDEAMITSWLQLGEDGTVTLDEGAVAAFVQSMASKYNTYGDERQFHTTNGDDITIGGGDYGWVINKDDEIAQLLQDLNGGKAVKREPVYLQTAKVHDLKNDIGSTYIEIDYTNQHLWYYKEGQLQMDTPIVSGNISRGNGSPDGIFKINYKKSPDVLRGEGYESEVDYFMEFALNVGIHDANWRPAYQFGGSTYRTAGSHGCVNVSPEAAAKLYGMLETDTPVVAYYREKMELKAENCRIANAYSYVRDKKED